MMKSILIKLSVLGMLINTISLARADSFFVDVRGTACTEINEEQTRAEIRYKAYDKAVLMAVKKCPEVKAIAQNMDDHSYNILAYRIADKALNDVTVITVQDDNEKICLEISGKLAKEQIAEIASIEKLPIFNEDKVEKIAQQVNTVLPKSMYETDSTLPLLYIKEMEYYNGKTTSTFTAKITEQLSFEPRVLVTESQELADYFIAPKLVLSKIEPINETNSRYSMSVMVELRKNDGTLVDSETQNRYIIISKEQNTQKIAHKLIEKLLEDSINALSGKLNSLLKD